jgi:flavodoxin
MRRAGTWNGRKMNPLAVILVASSLASWACSTAKMDAVTKATTEISAGMGEGKEGASDEVLMILVSAPGGNTEQIARAMASALGARILSAGEASAADLKDHEIIGFGSGIVEQKHHAALLAFVDALPPEEGKKAFIFSTSGYSRKFALDHGTYDTHTLLRQKLAEKGFTIVGEFNCEGFNANSFLKFFGGMNKGRPNAEDLARAAEFARGLLNEEKAP